MSPPSIYRHFADRNELIYAVCDRQWCHLTDAMDQAVEGIDDPWSRIAARGRAYIDFALANPEHYRVLMMAKSDALPKQHVNELPPGYEHLLDDVADALAAGQIPPTDPLLVATGLWMMVHGITSLMIAKPDFPWPPRDQLVDYVLAVHGRGLTGRDSDRL